MGFGAKGGYVSGAKKFWVGQVCELEIWKRDERKIIRTWELRMTASSRGSKAAAGVIRKFLSHTLQLINHKKIKADENKGLHAILESALNASTPSTTPPPQDGPTPPQQQL